MEVPNSTSMFSEDRMLKTDNKKFSKYYRILKILSMSDL